MPSLAIGTYSNIYLLIFLPLVFSLFCCFFSSQIITRSIAVSGLAAICFLLAKIFPDILINEKISNNFGSQLFAAGLEFRLDLLSLLFLCLINFFELIKLFFYKNSIKNLIAPSACGKFYAIFLLKIFGINGIILSNSLFDIYLFIEIYSFAYFGLACMVKNRQSATEHFRDFCFSAASSLLILLSFFAIFLAFGEHDLEKIVDSFTLLPQGKIWFLLIIFTFLGFAIFAKFFPLWQVIKNITNSIGLTAEFHENKREVFLENFLMADKLMVRTLLGVFLIMKFVFFLFGGDLLFEKNDFAAPAILGGFALVASSAYRLYNCKDLRLICAFLIAGNMGFICAAIGIHSSESLEAALFFLLSFGFVGMFIFLLSYVGAVHFEDFSLDFLNKLSHQNRFIALLLRFILLFLAAFPLTLQFFGYWHLAIASLSFGLSSLMLVALLFAHQSQMKLATSVIQALRQSFDYKNWDKKFQNSKQISTTESNSNEAFLKIDFSQIFALFALCASALLVSALSSKLHGFCIKLASYLLANTF